MSAVKLNYFEISRISTIDAKKVLATIEDDELHPGRKRRRLDNLNVEERILRRKLKNRVAAQTARDRKKAHMDQLEIAVQRIEKENKFLKKSNQELRSQVHQLTESNLQLRAKLGLTPPASPSQDHTCITVPNKSDKKELIVTPSVSDHDHIVIKQEELTTEHASLRVVSLLWNLIMTILLHLVRIYETSHRLNCYSIFSETKSPSGFLNNKLETNPPAKPPDIELRSILPTKLKNVQETVKSQLSSKKNLMLMIFYRMKVMSIFVHQAQNLSLRHQALAKEILMILSNYVAKQKPAWWAIQPLMDVG